MMFPSFKTLVAGLTFAVTTSAYSDTGSAIIVNGNPYYAGSAVAFISGITANQAAGLVFIHGSDIIPFSIIASNTSTFTASTLSSIVSNYTALDDVFSPGFMQVVYIKNSSLDNNQLLNLSASAQGSYGTTLVLQSGNDTANVNAVGLSRDLPVGPYFLSASTGRIMQAWRLYSDFQGSFTESLIAGENGSYTTFPAVIGGVASATVGVPSRLYYTKTVAKPLAGVRIGIKDIYDIAGVKTSCGNRAYYELYPERNTTAFAVQRLIDAGGIIVGKMKTSQFANGETATSDWIDYHAPYNARGDGYQDPSSSSSGPGSGIGSYAWLDVALGSDTGGSVRNPAQVNGAFGNRPSHDIVSLTGAMPLSPALDTAGLICRDASLWKTAAKALYQENITFTTNFPKKIYTSGFPANYRPTTEAETVLISFLNKLQTFLGANATALDLNAAWNTTGPVSANLTTYLNTVYPTLISQQQYGLVTLPFYADYARANNGRRPFINPSPLIRWTWGQVNITSNATATAIARKTTFMNWWNTNIQVRDNTTCSDSLFLYPGTLGTPNYRNVYRTAPGIPTGFSVSRISNFAEVPDMVFPIGQAAYNSTITLQTEYLPVAVDILAAKGCDGMIFELAERLQKAGIIVNPGTGSTMYAGEDDIYL